MKSTDDFGRPYLFSKKMSEGVKYAGDIDESNSDDANLIGSMVSDNVHFPVIDIDVPVRFEPSSTKGHGHLYLDIPMSWDKYCALMSALVAAGVVEQGYLFFMKKNGQSTVRPPWIKKQTEEMSK